LNSKETRETHEVARLSDADVEDYEKNPGLVGSIGIPEFLCRVYSVIPQKIIDPSEERVQDRGPPDHSPNGIMEDSRGFVERAHSDARAAIHPIPCPEGEALFGIDIPLEDPRLIGNIGPLGCHLTMGNGLRGTVDRAFPAGSAELGSPETPVRILTERKIGEDFA
jgi:hypothetical protein